MNKQTIQHHGKVYDAVTGRVIADVVPPKNYSPASARAPKIPRTSPGRKAANPNRHHTPRPASTLMRHAVKKPTNISKRQLHVKHEIQHNAIEVQSADGKSSLDTARLSRAQQVQKVVQLTASMRSNMYRSPMRPCPSSSLPQPLPRQHQRPHHRYQQLNSQICLIGQ